MKPLIKYRGGKTKEIPYIIKHIPKFNGRYIEPFFGGGIMQKENLMLLTVDM